MRNIDEVNLSSLLSLGTVEVLWWIGAHSTHSPMRVCLWDQRKVHEDPHQDNETRICSQEMDVCPGWGYASPSRRESYKAELSCNTRYYDTFVPAGFMPLQLAED